MSIVDEAIACYDELAERLDPGDHIRAVQRHWHAEAPVDAFVMRPFMIDEATYAERRAMIAHVLAAFRIATDRLATDGALRRALGIPAYLEPLLELDRDHGTPTTLGRIDGLVGADGRLVLIELNSEPQTAAFQYELERSFERLPIAAELAKRFAVRSVNLFDALDDALAERGRPTVAVLDKALWKSQRRAGVMRPLMYASARGCPVIYVEPEELEYRDGKLAAGGIRVDMVAFPTWELLINAKKRLVKVLKAIGDGAVGVFAGLSRGLLSSYKVVFELLTSPEHAAMFSPEQQAALANHVAWTRLLGERTTHRAGAEIDLLPWVAANRDSLVIKPSGGSGGSNIHIGRELTDEAWAAAIRTGIAQQWIVQELVVPVRQQFPIASLDGRIERHELACEYSPYVWNGTRSDGVLCRVVSGSVLFDNGQRAIGIANGVEAPTWIIDRAR